MLRSLITERARGIHLVAAVLAYLPLAAAMFGAMLGRVSAACGGLAPFDVRAGWDAADARAMLEACGEAGRAAYVQQQLLDLVYPAAVGAVLLLATALLLRRHGGRAWPLLLPVVLMTVLDYAENAGVWTLLLRWPELDAALADVTGMVTAVKRVTGFAAFGLPLVLAVAALPRWLRGRPGRRDALAPGRGRASTVG